MKRRILFINLFFWLYELKDEKIEFYIKKKMVNKFLMKIESIFFNNKKKINKEK